MDYDEGPAATPGPSRSWRPQLDDLPDGPGGDVRRSAVQQRAHERAERFAGRTEPLSSVWRRLMDPACEGKWASAAIAQPILNRGVKQLLDQGLTRPKIAELIELFANEVSSGRIKVDHKEPWFIFLKRWPKLGQLGGVGHKQGTSTEAGDWI